MSNYGVSIAKYLPYLLILLLVIPLHLPLRGVAAAETNDLKQGEGLSEAQQRSLQSTLSELRSLAPKLRVLLRTLRQRVGFDPREVHTIERSLGQSQKDLERMLAMHQRKAFNKLRAHFMADDLRRKSEALVESLGYIKRRIREIDKGSHERAADAELQKGDDALVELLGLYSNLVSDSAMLLKEAGI